MRDLRLVAGFGGGDPIVIDGYVKVVEALGTPYAQLECQCGRGVTARAYLSQPVAEVLI